MININISILFHFICIAFLMHLFRIFFNNLYDLLICYKNEKKNKENIHNEKKIAIEDMKKNIYLQGVLSNNDLIFYIRKSINYLDYNEKNINIINYKIMNKDLSIEDKIKIEKNIKKIIKFSIKE